MYTASFSPASSYSTLDLVQLREIVSTKVKYPLVRKQANFEIKEKLLNTKVKRPRGLPIPQQPGSSEQVAYSIGAKSTEQLTV